MTVFKRYFKLMHKWHLRDHLEKPMEPHNPYCVSTLHQNQLLDGAEHITKRVTMPKLKEDLTHLNPGKKA